MSANGDIMVGEIRLRTLMSAGADTLAAELDTVLGTAWDEAWSPTAMVATPARSGWVEPRCRLRGSERRRLVALGDMGVVERPLAGNVVGPVGGSRSSANRHHQRAVLAHRLAGRHFRARDSCVPGREHQAASRLGGVGLSRR